MLTKFSADMQMKHALTFTSLIFIFYLHTSHRRTHLKMEPESNKVDIILNCDQMHLLKLVFAAGIILLQVPEMVLVQNMPTVSFQASLLPSRV